MTTPVFPPDLPGVTSFKWTSGKQLLANEPPGPRSVRRLSRVPSATAEVQFQFVGDEYAVYMDFWRNDLIRGHRWFLLTLPSAAGFKPHLVRFKTHATNASGGHQFIRVTAEIDVRARRIAPEVLDIFITSTPYPVFVRDSLEAGAVPVALTMTEPLATDVEAVDLSMLPVGLTMAALVKSYTEDPEAVDAAMTALALTMAAVRRAYTVPAESVVTAFVPVLLTVQARRLEFEADTETIALGMTVQGLTLTLTP